MSRNNKNAKLHAAERQASAARKNGTKGAAKTTPTHGKKNAWWQRFESYAAYLRGGKRPKQEEI